MALIWYGLSLAFYVSSTGVLSPHELEFGTDRVTGISYSGNITQVYQVVSVNSIIITTRCLLWASISPTNFD